MIFWNFAIEYGILTKTDQKEASLIWKTVFT